jgi:hypothetical protein
MGIVAQPCAPVFESGRARRSRGAARPVDPRLKSARRRARLRLPQRLREPRPAALGAARFRMLYANYNLAFARKGANRKR